MTITEVKKEYVIENLGKGERIVMCDFVSLRMADCGEMTVNTINSFIEKPETKFFKVVESE